MATHQYHRKIQADGKQNLNREEYMIFFFPQREVGGDDPCVAHYFQVCSIEKNGKN